MSRVVLIVCGVALLAAVTVPFQSFYEGKYDSSMEDAADRLSFVIDDFWASEADTLTIRGWEVFPSSGSFVVIEGHSLMLYSDSKNTSYRSSIIRSMDKVVIGYHDEVTITKS